MDIMALIAGVFPTNIFLGLQIIFMNCCICFRSVVVCTNFCIFDSAALVTNSVSVSFLFAFFPCLFFVQRYLLPIPPIVLATFSRFLSGHPQYTLHITNYYLNLTPRPSQNFAFLTFQINANIDLYSFKFFFFFPIYAA